MRACVSSLVITRKGSRTSRPSLAVSSCCSASTCEAYTWRAPTLVRVGGGLHDRRGARRVRRTPPYLRQPRLLEGLHRVRGAAPHSWLLHHALHRGAPHGHARRQFFWPSPGLATKSSLSKARARAPALVGFPRTCVLGPARGRHAARLRPRPHGDVGATDGRGGHAASALESPPRRASRGLEWGRTAPSRALEP